LHTLVVCDDPLHVFLGENGVKTIRE
jgi:hypothetical protein